MDEVEALKAAVKDLEKELIEVYRRLGFARDEIKRLQEIISERAMG